MKHNSDEGLVQIPLFTVLELTRSPELGSHIYKSLVELQRASAVVQLSKVARCFVDFCWR